MSGYNADALRDMEKHLAGLTAAVAIVREELEGMRGHFERLVAEADRHKARVAELEAENARLRAHQDTLVRERDDAVLAANHAENEAKRSTDWPKCHVCGQTLALNSLDTRIVMDEKPEQRITLRCENLSCPARGNVWEFSE